MSEIHLSHIGETPQRYRFDRLTDGFLNNLRAAKRSDHTIAGYRRDLYGVGGRIADPQRRVSDAEALRRRVGALDVRELDVHALRAGFGSWADDHADSSQVRAWTVWNQFFNQLVGDDVLVRSPMRGLAKPKLPVTPPRSIQDRGATDLMLEVAATENPRAKLTKRWPERDLALVAIFSVTAIRLEEAAALDLESREGPQGQRRLQIKGKGRKERTIPIEAGLDALIDRYVASRVERHGAEAIEDSDSPLLVHYDGTRLTRGRIQYVIDQIFKRADIRPPKGARVHALRHTFATLAVENGIDVVELRDLLGHASLSTTSRYLDATGDRLREAVTAHPSQRALRRFSSESSGSTSIPATAAQ